MTEPAPQPNLDRLIRRLSILVNTATDTLQSDMLRADDWYDELARQLRRYHLAAYLGGSDSTQINATARAVIEDYIKTQLDFLSAFRDEIKASDEWKAAWNSRAEMYAEAIKAPWWAGHTRDWALPAMPGDGTSQCLTHCKCGWQIDELEGDGNADAYWRRSAAENCQTCIERSEQWAPLKIRDGEVL